MLRGPLTASRCLRARDRGTGAKADLDSKGVDPAVAVEQLDGRAGHLGQLPRGQEGTGRHGVARV